jgi:hypothetical protein
MTTMDASKRIVARVKRLARAVYPVALLGNILLGFPDRPEYNRHEMQSAEESLLLEVEL